MFNPMQAYYASATRPTAYENLDEEQSAQRHGQIVGECTVWNRIWLRVGKMLIHVGEKLTAENTPINWNQETV